MREIKFRGKPISDNHRKRFGEWIYGDLTQAYPNDYPPEIKHLVTDWYSTIPVFLESVGQYTGLIDCQGKEIYEGDVVTNHDKTPVYGEIVFGKVPDERRIGGGHQAFYIKWHINHNNIFSEWWRRDLNFWNKKVEIVGNIYENKDLLKEGDYE